MNSSLQCLSHSELLTAYFLSKKYLSEINLDNPLGSKGKVSKKYCQLVKHLWVRSEPVYSPKHFKKQVGAINPIYGGYN